jgi:hypothetical protein
MEITENELILALQEALKSAGATDSDGQGLTTTELVESLNGSGHMIGERRLRRELKQLVSAGIVRAVRVKRRNLAGIMQVVPAYEISSGGAGLPTTDSIISGSAS